jgi:hypothetical protein
LGHSLLTHIEQFSFHSFLSASALNIGSFLTEYQMNQGLSTAKTSLPGTGYRQAISAELLSSGDSQSSKIPLAWPNRISAHRRSDEAQGSFD